LLFRIVGVAYKNYRGYAIDSHGSYVFSWLAHWGNLILNNVVVELKRFLTLENANRLKFSSIIVVINDIASLWDFMQVCCYKNGRLLSRIKLNF
jgi:hypothetical protein